MIKPGSRWKSRVCSAEAIVVRPPKGEGNPQCGGVDMVPFGESAEPAEMVAGLAEGSLVGKRYRSEQSGIELLCTKGGTGSFGFAGERLEQAETKKLPASD